MLVGIVVIVGVEDVVVESVAWGASERDLAVSVSGEGSDCVTIVAVTSFGFTVLA